LKFFKKKGKKILCGKVPEGRRSGLKTAKKKHGGEYYGNANKKKRRRDGWG